MNNKSITEKITDFLKKKWWLSVVLIILMVLYLIPAYWGLPGDNYQGCEGEGKCQNVPIKTVTKENDGSETITLTVKITDLKNEDLNYNMPKGGDYIVGENVLVVYTPSIHEVTLFVAKRVNLLFDLTVGAIGSPGADAAFDSVTGKPLSTDPK